MRWPSLAVLVVIVALAGCSTPLLDDPGGRDVEYPAGVHENGSVNETALARITFASMNDSPVRVEHRNGNDSSTAVLGPEYAYTRDDSGAEWSGPRRSVSNDTWDADYSLDYWRNATVPRRADGPLRFGMVIRLVSGQFEHVGTLSRDGRRLHELEMVRPRGRARLLGHYEATLLVDDEGRLHDISGEVGDSEANATSFQFAFDWTVDRVPRPSWLASVPSLEANTSANDRFLVLMIDDGPSIPAGQTFRFYHDGTRGEVTLEEPLDPGETIYLGIHGSGGESTVVASRERPVASGFRSLAGDRTSLDGTVTLADGTTVDLSVDVGRRSL